MRIFIRRYLMPRLAAIFIFVLLFTLSACDEKLPVYVEPANVLVGSITSPQSGSDYNISVFEKYWRTPDSITHRYPSVTFNGLNVLGLEITVRNIYNDVVSDSTFVGGYVKIWDPIDQANVITHLIKRTDLSPNPDVLTINPGGFVKLKVDCKLRNDDGKYIWLDKPYSEIDGAYSPIPFRVKAYVRLYKKLGYTVTSEMTINLAVKANKDYGP
jgi:hypothetical protein